VIFGAGFPGGHKQPLNGFLGRAGESGRGAHGAALNKTVKDLRPFFVGQRLHKI
jgi:hypothetical protein